MADSRRDYEVKWAFSRNKESAYNTPVPDVDMTEAMLFRGPDFAEREPEFDTDEDEYGKGHEFPTRQTMLKWETKGKRQVKATAEMMAWAAAFGLGSVVTTQPNLPMNPTVYSHLFKPLPSATSKQLPSTSIVEQISDIRKSKFSGVILNDFMISGEGTEFVNLELNWIGSGKYAASPLTMPALEIGNMLWTHSVKLEIGDFGGSFTDVSQYLHSWEFQWNNELLADQGYFPGSNYQETDEPATGAIKGRLEYSARSCEISFKLLAIDDSILDDLEANQALKCRITMDGEVITVGQPEKYQAILSLPLMKYQMAPWETSDGKLLHNVTAKAFFDDVSSTYVSLTVVNEKADYLTV